MSPNFILYLPRFSSRSMFCETGSTTTRKCKCPRSFFHCLPPSFSSCCEGSISGPSSSPSLHSFLLCTAFITACLCRVGCGRGQGGRTRRLLYSILAPGCSSQPLASLSPSSAPLETVLPPLPPSDGFCFSRSSKTRGKAKVTGRWK